jgi:hypothetical protein
VALVGRRILGAPRFGGVATIAGGSNKAHASVFGGIASTLVEKLVGHEKRASSGCEFATPLVATQGCAGSRYKENTKWNQPPCLV